MRAAEFCVYISRVPFVAFSLYFVYTFEPIAVLISRYTLHILLSARKIVSGNSFLLYYYRIANFMG